jgi:hypothetical protein
LRNGVSYSTWFGLFAPGVRNIIAKLNGATIEALADPVVDAPHALALLRARRERPRRRAAGRGILIGMDGHQSAR